MGFINFIEQQRQVYLHDFLVFVCGVDISEHIQELDVNYSDRNGPSSIDIVLSNPWDQWVITSANLNNKWRTTGDRYTETPKKKIYAAKKTLSDKLVIKRKNAAATKDVKIQTGSSIDTFTNLKDAQQQEFLTRYNLGPGSTIFSRFDTVKVYVKHPTDSPQGNHWMPFFTGTVENKPVASNYINGESTVSLQCYDIRATMSGMRIAVNPYKNQMYRSGDAELQAQQRQQQIFFDSDAAGFFKDFYPGPEAVRNNGMDNIFAGRSFVDSVALITTGKTGWVSPAGGNKVEINEGNFLGVGDFKPGKVIKYAAKGNKSVTEKGVAENLEQWDNLCLFGLTGDGNFRTHMLTYSDCVTQGRQSFWTQKYNPLNGRVHFLIPANGLQISNLIREAFDGMSNIMESPDWQDRQSLVANICKQVDYEWSVTGCGDIIFEFPLYDFSPDDFGSNASIYRIDKHIETDNIAEESGDILSGLETQATSVEYGTRQVQENIAKTAAAVAVNTAMRAVAYSNVLASKYGAKIQHCTFNGIKTLDALKKITVVEFFKRLAECNKISLNFSYRPWLRPNRPIYHVTRQRMGRITAARHSLPPLREAKTSITIGSVRLPLIQKNKKGGIAFQHITGGDSSPLSYNSLFEGGTDFIGDSNQGIVVNASTQSDRKPDSPR